MILGLAHRHGQGVALHQALAEETERAEKRALDRDDVVTRADQVLEGLR